MGALCACLSSDVTTSKASQPCGSSMISTLPLGQLPGIVEDGDQPQFIIKPEGKRKKKQGRSRTKQPYYPRIG